MGPTSRARRRGRAARALATVLVALAAVAVAGPARLGASGARDYPVLVVGASPRADYVLVAQGCAALRCLVLERFDPVTARFARVARPPLEPARDSATGDLETLAFASRALGVALAGGLGEATRLYWTSDGARRWRRVDVPAGEKVLVVAAGGGALYAVLGRCRTTTSGLQRCGHYEIAHASATGWLRYPVPASLGVERPPYDAGPVLGSVAAFGPELYVSQLSGVGATPLRVSHDYGRTWRTIALAYPTLANIVDGCALAPEGPAVVWASCPTGMQVSFYRSADAGATWRGVRQGQYFGTGGGMFVAASATTAYLDYGTPRHVLYAVRAPTLAPEAIGPLPCASDQSETFSDVRHGAVVCARSGAATASPRLLVTSDQGHIWRTVTVP